jgi:PncC family amidohydrolase
MADALAERAAELLWARGLRVAVAEATGCGIVMHRLGAVPGASRYLIGGVVAYSNDVKRNVLGLTDGDLANGSVSIEAAQAMARRVRGLLHADVGLADTGIAGPGGGSPQRPLGTTLVALSAADADLCERHMFQGDRLANQQQTADAVLNLLLRYLLSLPPRT